MIPQQKILLISASVLGAIAVAIGAFGAHALKATLEANQRLDTFETGSRYHFYHVLAVILVVLLMNKVESKFLIYAGWFMIAGIILFSGSLYILAISNITKWGAVAPLGGLSFIIGWFLILISVIRN